MLLRKTGLRMALSLSPLEKQYIGILWAAEGDSLFLSIDPGYSFSYFPKFRSTKFRNTRSFYAMTQPYELSAELCEIRIAGEKNDNR